MMRNIPLSGATALMLHVGDSALVLSHRLTEWCGVAPMLEDDVALSNIALDLLGQARFWLSYAARHLDPPLNEDILAFHRDAADYQNLRLVELPRGDFAFTIVRQFLFDCWHEVILKNLASSSEQEIADIAAKAKCEVFYHRAYSRDWLVRLAGATQESRDRVVRALEECWPYTEEFFKFEHPGTRFLIEENSTCEALFSKWHCEALTALNEGQLFEPRMLQLGANSNSPVGTRHHLIALLSEMQSLTEQYPGASW